MMKKIYRRGSLGGSKEKEKSYDVSKLPEWIQNQEWRIIRSLFANARQDAVQFISEKSQEPVLHLVCRYHPPIDIVRLLYHAFPNAICIANAVGRYPIHLACRCGASPTVIQFLIKKNQLVASLQDSTGRTPLHITCEFYSRTYDPMLEGSKSLSPEEAITEVVLVLCEVAPGSVNLEDREDRSPTEAAIEFGAPLKVVKKIQKTSEKDWKSRRRLSEEDEKRSHAFIQLEIKKQVEEKQERLREHLLATTNAAMVMSLQGEQNNIVPAHEVVADGRIRRTKSLVQPRRKNQFRANAA
mmetsp:Transcript_2562/g.3622  ORF Transcript_2562/g.3622 Transcript_2562/m.3622 type:complete len:298 (+) Transcript_2562:164-1057(+)